MSFLAEDPMKAMEQPQRPHYIQGGQAPASQPGLGDKLMATAGAKATDMALKGPLQSASTALLGTAGTAATATTAATAGTGMLGALGGMGAAGAAAAPMLAALGPFALMALPLLLKDGTSKVPEQNYGADPFPQGFNGGTTSVAEEPFVPGKVPRGFLTQMLSGGGGDSANTLESFSPMMALAGGKGLESFSPMMALAGGEGLKSFSPMMMAADALGFNNGTAGVNSTTNMQYAGGTDSVPAMLTPGEAIIPAAAAQNPANKPMIDSMVSEGREANSMAQGGPLQQPPGATPDMAAGPLSGKTKREQMKLLQDLSLKKKTWEADEQRKQEAFDQKMSQDKLKAMLSMRQSQE